MRRFFGLVLAIFVFCFVFAAGNYNEVLSGLMEAEETVIQMKQEGFSVFFFQDNLLEAKKYFVGMDSSYLVEEIDLESDSSRKEYLGELIVLAESLPSFEKRTQDYDEASRLAEVIVLRREQAYRIFDGISLFEDDGFKYKDQGIDTEDALVILGSVREAFEGERYDDAEVFLEEANLRLNELVAEKQKINSAILATQGFFVRYWWQSLLVFAFLIAISIPVYKKIDRHLKVKRLARLRVKLVTTKELLKKAQTDCFKSKIITTETYRIREKRYKDNMVKIENKIRILERVLGQALDKKNASGAKTIGLRITR